MYVYGPFTTGVVFNSLLLTTISSAADRTIVYVELEILFVLYRKQ